MQSRIYPELRVPAQPHIFLRRARIFACSLSLVQLAHLIFFTDADLSVYVGWVLVSAIVLLSISMIELASCNAKCFELIPWRPLIIILVASFITKIYSRLDYITSTFAYGLHVTRNDSAIGVETYLTYINIFFYPSLIVLAFAKLPKAVYRYSVLLGAIIFCIDFVFIGTRNAPMFVIIILILTSRINFDKRKVWYFAAFLLLFLAIFSYSTIYRGGNAEEFRWLEVFESTGSSQILRINTSLVPTPEIFGDFLYPLIFLLHYITHSIGEIVSLVNSDAGINFGGLYFITDQFCSVGFCDRMSSIDDIRAVDDRYNVYKTIFGTLFYDFGILCSLILWVVFLFLICINQRISSYKMGLVTPISTVIIMLGSIENYLFNGLNLFQVLMIFFIYSSLIFFKKLT